jgi:ADP-ribose pyrophosphatase YjhB (NUDIX family)
VGHPHATIDVPGHHPALLTELAKCAVDPNGHAAELARGIAGVAADVPAGHVCATAWIFDSGGDHVLLVRHARLGWSSPGGHCQPGEVTADAVRREIAEETGLTEPVLRCVLPGPLTVHVTDGAEAGHRHWNVAYLFTADLDAVLTPEHGASPGEPGSLRWIPVHALGELDVAPDDLATVTPWAHEVLRNTLA